MASSGDEEQLRWFLGLSLRTPNCCGAVGGGGWCSGGGNKQGEERGAKNGRERGERAGRESVGAAKLGKTSPKAVLKEKGKWVPRKIAIHASKLKFTTRNFRKREIRLPNSKRGK